MSENPGSRQADERAVPAPHGEPEDGYYGGQAVLEGVMMRNRHEYATAVRRMDGRIVLQKRPVETFTARHRWARWPLIRGFFGFIDAFVLGYRSLDFSAQVAVNEEQERLRAAKPAQDADRSEAEERPSQEPKGFPRFLMYATLTLSICLGLGLFAVLPTLVAGWTIPGPPAAVTSQTADQPSGTPSSWLKRVTGGGPTAPKSTARNVVEGGVRLVVIIGYMLGISLMKQIRRVFQYHGAEHKVINTFEAGEEVTVTNARRFSTIHPRCGTGFILIVIAVKLIAGWALGWPVWWIRVPLRLLLLVPVAMISYELLRLGGKYRHSLFTRVLIAPGMALQRITTREPDNRMLEVAIHALAAVCPTVSVPQQSIREVSTPQAASPEAQPASST